MITILQQAGTTIIAIIDNVSPLKRHKKEKKKKKKKKHEKKTIIIDQYSGEEGNILHGIHHIVLL